MNPPAASARVPTCLNAHGGALYACATWARDGFALGVSQDGATWEPYLGWFSEIDGQIACPEGTPARTQCDALWPTIVAQFRIPVDGGTETKDGGADGGTTPPPPKGCGCGAAEGATAAGLVALALAAVLGRRRFWSRRH